MANEETVILESPEVKKQVIEVVIKKNEEPTQEKGISFLGKTARVAAGFVGGILLGSVGVVATAKPIEGNVDPDLENGEDTDAIIKGESEEIAGGEVVAEDAIADQDVPAWTDGEVGIASTVNDKMSYGDAFLAAREELGEGGAFEWRGNVYSTYTTQEWEELSDEVKQEYNSHFVWNSYGQEPEVDPNLGQESEEEVIEPNADPMPSQNESEEEVIEPNADPMPSQNKSDEETEETEDVEVELLGVEVDQDLGALIGELAIGEQDVYLIDINPGLSGDNTFDVAVVDINNDGVISEEEVVDISDAGLNVEEFAAEAAISKLYADMAESSMVQDDFDANC